MKFIIALLLFSSLAYSQQSTARLGPVSTATNGADISWVGTGIQYHQVIWFTQGTVSTCTLTLDSSADGVSYISGGAIPSQTCTSNGGSAFLNGVYNHGRIAVATVTGGGTVSVYYLGYASLPAFKVGIDQSSQGVSNGISLAVIGSTLNSSTAQISSGLAFTGLCESTLASNSIQVNVVTDQPLTVEVDQSAVANCSSIASAFTYTVAASSTSDPYANYTTQATNSFYRIKVTNNGGVATTTFRVDVALCPICNYGFASGGTFFTPSNQSSAGITPIPSTAVESGHVLKASPGNLYGLTVTSTVNGLIMIFNSTTVPADGAVTPVYCLRLTPDSGGAGSFGVNFSPGPPAVFSTGISAAMSTGTNCASKTASATAWFTGLVK